MENNPDVFTLMEIFGGLFLLYLGIEMMRAEAKKLNNRKVRGGLCWGFFIGFLNPKIAVFMLAVLLLFWTSRCHDTKWFVE